MNKADKHGWRDIESVPNNVFDVIAEYYDAGLNMFMITRFCGCVLVDGRVRLASAFPGSTVSVDLMANGYRPTHWRHLPKPPLATPQQRTGQ